MNNMQCIKVRLNFRGLRLGVRNLNQVRERTEHIVTVEGRCKFLASIFAIRVWILAPSMLQTLPIMHYRATHGEDSE